MAGCKEVEKGLRDLEKEITCAICHTTLSLRCSLAVTTMHPEPCPEERHQKVLLFAQNVVQTPPSLRVG